MNPATTLLCVLAAAAAGALVSNERRAGEDPDVQRGHHIVHDVAMCVQCHTPRDDDGNLLETQLLAGAAVPVRPPEWAGNERGWAFRAPHIAGLPGYSDEDAVRLLTRSLTADDSPPRAPMPLFRLTEDEARAVVAYLRSIE